MSDSKKQTSIIILASFVKGSLVALYSFYSVLSLLSLGSMIFTYFLFCLFDLAGETLFAGLLDNLSLSGLCISLTGFDRISKVLLVYCSLYLLSVVLKEAATNENSSDS